MTGINPGDQYGETSGRGPGCNMKERRVAFKIQPFKGQASQEEPVLQRVVVCITKQLSSLTHLAMSQSMSG